MNVFLKLLLASLCLISIYLIALTSKNVNYITRDDLWLPQKVAKPIHHDDDSFPEPAFLGCNEKQLCRFSNVCFSGLDHMLVFHDPSKPLKGNWSQLQDITTPRRPRFIPYYNETYPKLDNIYFAKKLFVVNCWRQWSDKFNPAHLLMGIGKLFVAATGYYTTAVDPFTENPFPVDLVLYHHCPDLQKHSWPWGNMVENFIWQYAVEQNIIRNDYITDLADQNGKLYMPLPRKLNGSTIGPNEFIVCGETVYQEPFSVARYFGPNPPGPIYLKQWQALIQSRNLTAAAQDDHGPKKITDLCASRQLRVAMWKRTEGSALRLLTNEDDIRTVVREFTEQPLRILTASSKTSFRDQVSMLRSFDIMITPHGSHLTNMVFAHAETAFIEVAAAYYDNSIAMNGPAFTKKWIQSFGHTPTDSSLASQLDVCLANQSVDGPCPRQTRLKLIQSDLMISTTTLRLNLQEAVQALCEPLPPLNP